MLTYISCTLAASILAYLYQLTSDVKDNRYVTLILKRYGSIFFFLAFTVIFSLSAFRVGVGLDYPAYVRLFNDISAGDSAYFEPGFTLLIQTIQIFTDDPQWLFITSSLLTLGGIFIAIKRYSASPALSVFLFCTMGFLSHSLNLTRQFIAIAIILHAYRFIAERKLFKYVIIIGLAALFHKTALIMLPAYFILKTRFKPVHYLLILLLSLIISMFQGPIINGLIVHFYAQYYDESFVGEVILSKYYIIISLGLSIAIIYLLTRRRLLLDNLQDRVMVNTAFMIILAHTCFVWLPLSNRVSLYFDIALIIIIPLLLSRIHDKIRRTIITTLLVMYFAFSAYSSLQDNSNGVLPYRSIFSYSTLTDHKMLRLETA